MGLNSNVSMSVDMSVALGFLVCGLAVCKAGQQDPWPRDAQGALWGAGPDPLRVQQPRAAFIGREPPCNH